MKLRLKRILIGALSLSLCLSAPFGGISQASAATSTVNPYTGKTFVHDTRFQNYTIYNGIDVSKYQASIDWKKVKAAGIDYAFIRCGYSGTQSSGHATDPYYASNIQNAYAAGIKIGIYYFSQALTASEAASEAKYALDLIRPYKDKITLPVVFDFEFGTGTNASGKSYAYRANALQGKKSTVTNNAITFMKAVQAEGYTGMYYGNKTTLNGSFDVSKLKSYPCWLASYPASTTKTFSNGYTGDYTFWQYSSSGKVNGITGSVDMNFYYAASETNNYVNGTPSPTPAPATPTTPTPATTTTKPSAVTGFKQLRNTATSITLSWKKNTSATGYEIYRSTARNGKYSKVKTITKNTTTSWKNTARAKNRIYYYKIRAYKTVNGKKTYSGFSAVKLGHTNKYSGKYKRTKAALNVRSYAGTAYKKVATLSKNKRVKLLYATKDKNGVTWYKVSWSGKTGYVSGRYLK